MVGKQSAPPEEESIYGGETPENELEDNGKLVSKGNPGYGIWVAGGNATAGEDESTGPLYISGPNEELAVGGHMTLCDPAGAT